MKLLLSIFTLAISSSIGLCQGSKSDSLKNVLVSLESERKKLDEEIKKVNDQISQALTEQFKNDRGILSIRSTGGYLMSGPSHLSATKVFIPRGNMVHISRGYYNDGYLKANYQNSEGFIAPEVLEQTEELKTLIYNGSRSIQEKSTQPSNLLKSGSDSSTPSKSQTRTYHRGPKGGCYYVNSNGNKTYVDRSICN